MWTREEHLSREMANTLLWLPSGQRKFEVRSGLNAPLSVGISIKH